MFVEPSGRDRRNGAANWSTKFSIIVKITPDVKPCLNSQS